MIGVDISIFGHCQNSDTSLQIHLRHTQIIDYSHDVQHTQLSSCRKNFKLFCVTPL